MSVSLTYAAVDATRSIPELYAPAGGRPPSLAIQGEDLEALNQRPQAVTASPPAQKVLTGTPAAGSAPAPVSHDVMTSHSTPSIQPSPTAASGRDVQLGVNFDTLA